MSSTTTQSPVMTTEEEADLWVLPPTTIPSRWSQVKTVAMKNLIIGFVCKYFSAELEF